LNDDGADGDESDSYGYFLNDLLKQMSLGMINHGVISASIHPTGRYCSNPSLLYLNATDIRKQYKWLLFLHNTSADALMLCDHRGHGKFASMAKWLIR
jgi:hypothetical protein